MTDLYTWMHRLNAELDIDIPTEVVAAVLDLAREAAHSIVRPAAPMSTFMAGYAVGRTDSDTFPLERALDVTQLARGLILRSNTSPPRIG